MPREEKEIWVWRADGEICRDQGRASCRIVNRECKGDYSITVRRRRGLECHHVFVVRAEARLRGLLVGVATGYSANLNRYPDSTDFVTDMDAIDQTTYDGAEAIAALGWEYWLDRDLFLFLDHAEVAPQHRGQGLGRALVEAIAKAVVKKGHCLDMLLQPYPLAIISVDRSEIEGRRLATPIERKREMEKTTQVWLHVFPFLSFLSRGGLHKDRRYYFGRMPNGR